MWTRLAFPVLALAVVVLVAVTSIASAARMAPDRGEAAIGAFELAQGVVLGDACGADPSQAHHCPFCHALPEAPKVGHDGMVFLLTPHDGWRRLRELQRAAQTRNLSHSPRAPPVFG